MPKPGWTSITIKSELYERIRAEYHVHKRDLAKVGIHSTSSFAEMLLIESLGRWQEKRGLHISVNIVSQR